MRALFFTSQIASRYNKRRMQIEERDKIAYVLRFGVGRDLGGLEALGRREKTAVGLPVLFPTVTRGVRLLSRGLAAGGRTIGSGLRRINTAQKAIPLGLGLGLGAGSAAVALSEAYHQSQNPDMADGMQTGYNPFRLNFCGYNTQGFARSGAPLVGEGNVYAAHHKTDTTIDARNQKMWDQNPDPDANVLVNRGSTVLRNAQPVSIGNITPQQRRAVIDHFDASHRSGGDEGIPLPKVRPFSRERLVGAYHLGYNNILLSPDSRGFSPEMLVAHEMSHWQRDTRRRRDRPLLDNIKHQLGYAFSKKQRAKEEYFTDAGALRLNRAAHPNSRVPLWEEDLLVDALENKKSLVEHYRDLFSLD